MGGNCKAASLRADRGPGRETGLPEPTGRFFIRGTHMSEFSASSGFKDHRSRRDH